MTRRFRSNGARVRARVGVDSMQTEGNRRLKHGGTPALPEDDGCTGKDFNHGQKLIRTRRTNEACS